MAAIAASPYFPATTLSASVDNEASPDNLTDEGCHRSAVYTHIKTENQQGVKQYVQHCSREHAEHGIHGVALKTHLIVECERGCHKRNAEQNNAQIVFCIWEYCGR